MSPHCTPTDAESSLVELVEGAEELSQWRWGLSTALRAAGRCRMTVDRAAPLDSHTSLRLQQFVFVSCLGHQFGGELRVGLHAVRHRASGRATTRSAARIVSR